MSHPWQEVGDRAFVRRYDLADQTIGTVVGSDGVLVIDTRGSHRMADELRSDLVHLTSRPVTAVVNTHGHWDHVFGNGRFRRTAISGHVRCATMVTEAGERVRERLIAASPEHEAELREVVITPPNLTFDDAAVLDLGDRSVHIRHLGRGHTDNDVVIDVADANVIFAGDLLENGAPPVFGDAYPFAWAATAQRVADLGHAGVVPGHGDPADEAFARRQTGELEQLGRLLRDFIDGQIGEVELRQRSPYPAETTEIAAERARLELDSGN